MYYTSYNILIVLLKDLTTDGPPLLVGPTIYRHLNMSVVLALAQSGVPVIFSLVLANLQLDIRCTCSQSCFGHLPVVTVRAR